MHFQFAYSRLCNNITMQRSRYEWMLANTWVEYDKSFIGSVIGEKKKLVYRFGIFKKWNSSSQLQNWPTLKWLKLWKYLKIVFEPSV